jgi:hypothetical protein
MPALALKQWRMYEDRWVIKAMLPRDVCSRLL